MADQGGGITAKPGEVITFCNKNPGGMVFRVRLGTIGWVEFSVAPGATFQAMTTAGDINVDIQSYEAPGLRSVDDDDGKTSSG